MSSIHDKFVTSLIELHKQSVDLLDAQYNLKYMLCPDGQQVALLWDSAVPYSGASTKVDMLKMYADTATYQPILKYLLRKFPEQPVDLSKVSLNS